MDDNSETVSDWITPDQVMKNRRLKAKKAAIQARLNSSNPLNVYNGDQKAVTPSQQPFKRNPFRDPVSYAKKRKISSVPDDKTPIIDLFKSPQPVTAPEANYINMLQEKETLENNEVSRRISSETLHVGWRLHSRAHFFSDNPLPWKHIFKTSEEASGITGFVRCMQDEDSGPTLDTSTNAKFFQKCLVWQYPNLPGVTLFPRNKDKSSNLGIFAKPDVAKTLHVEWGDSLLSLYRLLRVRQCAYFYVVASSFTCLFRASGVGGFPHAHALVTPTEVGFRNTITKAGIEFSMPFRKQEPNEDSDEDEIENEQIFTELGLGSEEISALDIKRKKKVPKETGTGSTLICIEDMELHGFVNFLINCKSCCTNTGASAGVPPTLISPCAFVGGSLKSLKVRGATVRTTEGNIRYGIELTGPILPTTLLQMCEQLKSCISSFEVTVSSIESSLPLSSVCSTKPNVPLAFGQENLVDCGMNIDTCAVICQGPVNEKQKLLPPSTEIKFKDNVYSWTI